MLAQETETGGNKASANRRHLTGNRANNARPRLLLSPLGRRSRQILSRPWQEEEREETHHLSFRVERTSSLQTDRLGYGHDTANDIAAHTLRRKITRSDRDRSCRISR